MSIIEQRRSERFSLEMSVEIRTSRTTFVGKVKDISETGMGLDNTFAIIEPGEKVAIDSEQHGTFHGKIQWKSMSGFGVEFDQQTRHSSTIRNLIKELRAAETEPG